jgi:hypothetical protein
MKKPLFSTIILSIILLFGFNTVSLAQQIHTDELDAYWKITDQLRKGDTLNRDTWNTFLELPGVKKYVKNQAFDVGFLERYRKAMQTVYMPQYADKVKKMMEHPFDYWIYYKINQYQEHETELRAYARRLQEPAYLDSMYKRTWAWLPKRLQKKSPSTSVFFINFDNDAIAQGDSIVFTLWCGYNCDKLNYGMLGGHEFHHILRGQAINASIKPADEGIMYALLCIVNEGTADMVDKNYELNNEKLLPTEYRPDDLLLTHPDSIIKQIDTAMQVMIDTKEATFKTERQYRKLTNYSSGHDPGFYMANIIVRNGYQQKLIEHVQSPFYFVYLYNKAAKKDKQHPPVFSDKAIGYVKILEKRYWKNDTPNTH